MNLITALEKRSKLFWVATGFGLVALLGAFDFVTGYEISFSLFYVMPISLVTWFTSRRFGVITSIASALIWLWADVATGRNYSHPLIYFWNTAIRFGFFIIITLLLSELKRILEHERWLSRTDSLTGAVNARYFLESMQLEIDRSVRYKHPFTIAYIDLDNFKVINDRHGHNIGDKVLSAVGSCLRRQLRKIDIVARLGGDEFALLLPETGGAECQAVIAKVQRSLLDEVRTNNWPVTFSIGVLACADPPHTAEELLKLADDLMYSVKNQCKNGISYSSYPSSFAHTAQQPLGPSQATDD